MADWWTTWPWRMIQTNLREIDMLDINAAHFVADLREFKATAVLFNMAGIIASYPTKLSFHFQSPFLKGDSLEKIIATCHAAGIKFLARTDFSKIRRPIYEAHPEWAYLTPKGEVVDYNGDIHACVNGGYQQEYALQIIAEVISSYPVDGIFFNMGGYQVRDYSGNYHGICHCESCRTRFAAMFSLPLPQVEDLADPLYRKYAAFKRQTLREHHAKVYGLIQRLRPNLAVANHTDFRRGLVRQESNTAVDRPLPHWQYSASENTKWVTSSYRSMVSSNTTVDFMDIPYRHVAISPHQQQLRLAQNLANGGSLDYYLIGRLDNHADRSGFAPVKRMFHYHAAHERDYADLVSKANIGLLNGPEANQSEFRGWFRFLVESHFLFDTLMTDTALELPWDKYQAIILPDYQPVGDALATKLDRFVADGGTVIAVGCSAFRDKDFELRTSPALECLGIKQVRLVRPKMRSAYLKLDSKEGFGRFGDTDLIYLDGDYVYAEYEPTVTPRLKLIPPHMFGPPERCYYTTVTEHPGFTVNTFGAGKGIYIPWLPGSLYYRQGHTNTLDFAADLLENVAGIGPVGGPLSPMLEVTLFEKNDSTYQLLHLVNGSGHFGTTFFAPVPMLGLEVVLRYAGQPHSVTSLVSGSTLPHSASEGLLRLTVPRIELFEAIRITR